MAAVIINTTSSGVSVNDASIILLLFQLIPELGNWGLGFLTFSVCFDTDMYKEVTLPPPPGLYKILFHFKASVHELISRTLPYPPPAFPTLLQYLYTTTAQYATLPRSRFRILYTIQ